MTWEGRTFDGTYGLRLNTTALRDLDLMCRDSGRVETGGILIGRYSPDLVMAVVQQVTPPPSDSRQGYSWFDRGIAGLREMLARKWQSKERTYYLGEWHYHPSRYVKPSTADIEQMYTVRDDPSYNCAEPVLVIVGEHRTEKGRIQRAFVFPRNGPYMEFIYVGG